MTLFFPSMPRLEIVEFRCLAYPPFFLQLTEPSSFDQFIPPPLREIHLIDVGHVTIEYLRGLFTVLKAQPDWDAFEHLTIDKCDALHYNHFDEVKKLVSVGVLDWNIRCF